MNQLIEKRRPSEDRHQPVLHANLIGPRERHNARIFVEGHPEIQTRRSCMAHPDDDDKRTQQQRTTNKRKRDLERTHPFSLQSYPAQLPPNCVHRTNSPQSLANAKSNPLPTYGSPRFASALGFLIWTISSPGGQRPPTLRRPAHATLGLQQDLIKNGRPYRSLQRSQVLRGRTPRQVKGCEVSTQGLQLALAH